MAKKGKRKDGGKTVVTSPKFKPTTRRGVYVFCGFIFVVSAMPLAVSLAMRLPIGFVIAAAVYLLLIVSSVRVAQQWEKVVVLRLGHFDRIEGPGLFFVLPFVDSAVLHVDQRIMTTSFSAEEALTANLVPTDVDAVLFWMVVDPEKACCEVGNYSEAVLWSAQTALRDAIGRVDLADISIRRSQLDHELKETLNDKTSEWGIAILSVEIRNIVIPKNLQDVMSREAQAQQESNARLVLAEIEKQISELLLDAAKVYHEDELAFQIRIASLINESIKESNNGLVVVPSSFGDGFNAKGSNVLKTIFDAKN